MADKKFQEWEYRVQSIGNLLSTSDENIQSVLNGWGREGWEAIVVYTPSGGGRVTIIAKRPTMQSIRPARPRA